MKKLNILMGVLLSSYFTATLSYAGVSDGNGYIWTPDGMYESNSAMAEFDTSRKYGSLIAGNHCAIEGKLIQPNKSQPKFLMTNLSMDGIGCPYIKSIKITVLDGYAVRALGNASKIRVSHTKKSGYANFNGIYYFK